MKLQDLISQDKIHSFNIKKLTIVKDNNVFFYRNPVDKIIYKYKNCEISNYKIKGKNDPIIKYYITVK